MVDRADIESILAGGESVRVEFTESLNNTDKYCRAICAFANDMDGSGKPGYLIIGVGRDGRPVGATIAERFLEALTANRNNGQILPIPDMHVDKFSLESGEVAVVTVNPSDAPPVRYKREVCIRTGPTGGVATPEQERRLGERAVDRAKTWDMRGCVGATLDDLALDIFKLSYLPNAVSAKVLSENGRSIEEQLSSLRFYNRARACPANAAVLLFGRDPAAFFPGAYVQYVKYGGTSQATRVLEERRIAGDLLTVFRDLDSLAERLAVRRPVRESGLRETAVADYPAVAMHELFINSVIHRNYDGSTTPVSINEYADRVEIINPGSLYGDLTKGQFPHLTSYRNPVLAEAAKVLGFANQFGRGIAVVQDELNKNGSPKLDYTIGENHMLMVVRRRM
ncbi:MAG: RNA-binding domain-containing protein [Phycisphaerae bacterium]